MKFQAYLITCLVSGHCYVGITSRGMRQRWNEHLYSARKRPNVGLVNRAIAKYGSAAFTIAVIMEASSWKELCALEPVLIKKFNARAPNGYNLSNGGEGPFGIKRSPESVEKSAAKHRGNPCHENTRRASSITHKGIAKSAAHRAKISASKIGIKRSETTKEKIRIYWSNRRANGDFKTSKPYEHARKEASS
jgi:group I intron endonuclease